MQNDTNLSVEKMNSILNMLKNGTADTQKLSGMLRNALDDKQKSTLNSILSDPQKLRDLLSSPQAKEMIEKLRKNQNGENKNGPA